MAVAKEEIKKIIEATDMYALVSPYVKLQKSGSGYKGLCPFHNEKTPSFSVSQEKHLAHCFSCGKGGNPIQFLMDIKHISFLEAVKELADFNHIKIDLNSVDTKEELAKLKYYNLNNLAEKLFTRNLFSTNTGQLALDYLKGRGLDEETIKTFGIGLAPKDGNTLYNLLKQSNYLELDMVDASLVKNNGDKYQDFFINRITFPIKDVKGNIVAFSGRDYTNSSNAKYMNSSETLVFKKNLLLYNLDLAINQITLNDRIILHEGYMDVIASYRAGLKEVVCSMGTSLTDGQIKQITRLTKNVILCYDSDNAGVTATIRAFTLLHKYNLNVSVVKLDKTKDSDEYVKKYGLKTYYEYFNTHIVSFIEYYFNELTNKLDINDIFKIEEVKTELFKYLKMYNSNIITDKYLNLFASKLGVSYSSLINDYDKNITNITPNEISIKPKEIQKDIGFKIYEIRLFDYAKSKREIAYQIDDFLEKDNNFLGVSEIYQQLWQTLMNFYSYNEIYNEELFNIILKEKKLYDNYYEMILASDKFKARLDLEYNQKDLDECLNKIAKKAHKRKLNNLQNSINKQTDENLQKELTLKKFNMRKLYERK